MTEVPEKEKIGLFRHEGEWVIAAGVSGLDGLWVKHRVILTDEELRIFHEKIQLAIIQPELPSITLLLPDGRQAVMKGKLLKRLAPLVLARIRQLDSGLDIPEDERLEF